MIKFKVLFLTFFALFCQTADVVAQEEPREIVVVMKRDYTYEDPRWSHSVTLDKGKAITVMDDGGPYYNYWPYPAADVSIPRNVTRLPGSNGEKYLQLNGTNVRLREGPSTRYGFFCYDAASGASTYQYRFIHDGEKTEPDEWETIVDWTPYYLPKGIRLPYLGKENGFYKTRFNGTVFYISARYCLLKSAPVKKR